MTSPAYDSQTVALRVWRRLTAAIDTGAPVPSTVDIRPERVMLAYLHEHHRDVRTAAAAMVRTLGLTGPVTHQPRIIHWSSAPSEEGPSWEVWAHLPGGEQ